MQTSSNPKGLSGAAIKWLALITMTVDHIGLLFFPSVTILRIIGRLAFPLFGYMIAEGCVHTRDRKAYLMRTAGLALLCQVAYFAAEGSLYMCILVTFSLSIFWIMVIDKAKDSPSAPTYAAAISRRRPSSLSASDCRRFCPGRISPWITASSVCFTPSSFISAEPKQKSCSSAPSCLFVFHYSLRYLFGFRFSVCRH